MSKDDKSVIDEFHQVVNMTPEELESWLETTNSYQLPVTSFLFLFLLAGNCLLAPESLIC